MDAPAISEIRARLLKAAVTDAGGQEGLLFEPASVDAKTAIVTQSTDERSIGDWSAGVSTEMLLARWLRVNGVILALPEPTGLWTSLPASAREWLVRREVRACIPLVHDMKLAGWIFVLGGHPWEAMDPRATLIGAGMTSWARALSAAQAQLAAAAREALVSRSNRLSVAGQLAASGAHEVRNCLASVRSMVQLVLDNDVPPAEHASLLGKVLVEVDRVNASLSRTLAMGRAPQTTWVSIDVSQLVTDAASFCEAYAHRRSQRIAVRGGVKAWIRGDRNELRQVLVNVLLNACQASAEGAAIEIEDGIADTGEVSVVIRDRGTGMGKDLVARAFEPFYSTKQDGGGLGLAISQDIVRRHGGTIVLQSTIGSGTTVTIQLPFGGEKWRAS